MSAIFLFLGFHFRSPDSLDLFYEPSCQTPGITAAAVDFVQFFLVQFHVFLFFFSIGFASSFCFFCFGVPLIDTQQKTGTEVTNHNHLSFCTYEIPEILAFAFFDGIFGREFFVYFKK